MDKTNLVYVKGGEEFEHEYSKQKFKPNKPYRSSKLSKIDWVVNGCKFDAETFQERFQFVHDRVMHHWSDMGLLDGDKPISKKKFKELADIHEYGFAGGLKRSRLRIFIFSNATGIYYGFYPMADTKANNIDECYQMYVDTVNGNMEYFDCGDIQCGDKGIPISYGNLRSW